MILASVTLPVDAGLAAHLQLKNALCRMAGGYTALKGEGAWLDPDGELVEEAVVQYQVAVNGPGYYGDLSVLVHTIGRIGRQKAVYWTFDNSAYVTGIAPFELGEAA